MLNRYGNTKHTHCIVVSWIAIGVLRIPIEVGTKTANLTCDFLVAEGLENVWLLFLCLVDQTVFPRTLKISQFPQSLLEVFWV